MLPCTIWRHQIPWTETTLGNFSRSLLFCRIYMLPPAVETSLGTIKFICDHDTFGFKDISYAAPSAYSIFLSKFGWCMSAGFFFHFFSFSLFHFFTFWNFGQREGIRWRGASWKNESFAFVPSTSIVTTFNTWVEWLTRIPPGKVLFAMSEFSYVVPIIAKLSAKFDSSDYKLIDVRGIPQNPSFEISRFEEIIDSFKTRDGDVFVTTFVKAGCIDFISSLRSFSFMYCSTLWSYDQKTEKLKLA